MTPEQQPTSGPHKQAQQGPGPPVQSARAQAAGGGLSSHGASRKRISGANFDRSAYTAGQTLVTVVNDPRADAAKNWGAWLGFRVPDVSWQEPPPPIDSMRYPPVTHRDLAKYLALIADGSYEQFQQARQSLALGGISQQLMMLGGEPGDFDDDAFCGAVYDGYGTDTVTSPLGDSYHVSEGAGAAPDTSQTSTDGPPREPSRPAAPRLAQGDGLVTALQVVPPLFFNEDFSLSRPDIFEAICGCEDDGEMYARIDKLSAALDVVETQLMREIASRSRAIVAAGNCVHDLHKRLSVTLAHIKRLRENVSDMDDVTYSAAVRVAQLQRRRGNLSAAVEQVKALEEVAAAKAALPLLLESGDYAGALEMLDNLSHASAGLSASGVAAFRGLPPQLADSRQVVESLLQSEMLSAAVYTEAHLGLERAVAESAQALGLTTTPLALTPADSANAPLSPSVSAGGSASSGGSGLGLGGLGLRAAGSFSLLAAELAASREQLHDRLLPVVLGLHRCERLEAALRQFAANRAAEVKAIVREVVERLLPQHLALAGITMDGSGGGGGAAGGGAAGSAGAAAAGLASGAGGSGAVSLAGADGGSGGFGSGELSLAEKLGVLPHLGFLQVLMVITSMLEAYLAHTLLVGSLVEDALRSGRAPAAALAAPRREVHAALQAVVDVATGRWAKLMAARSDVHSRLKVYEFRALLSACEAFAALPDMHGLRPGAALRPTLQALCRAHLENTHSRCAMQMQHLLEAEQWVPAEAHASFQAIVDRLEDRCPGARPAPEEEAAARQQQGSAALAADGQATITRPTEGLLRLGGRHYWPVNALLMLLKLLDEHYMGLLPATPPPAAAAAGTLFSQRRPAPVPSRGAVPGSASPSPQAATWALSSVGPDVAQRCLELLRTFNTVAAQQVLGAAAMRTAGLKSISAKHLALAAQSLAALLAALPLLRWQLAAVITDGPRRALLMPEFDRLAQDLNLHVEEIHGKLVDIMQDRVLAACRQVAADSDAWARASPAQVSQQVAHPAPSEALRLLARQLGTLRSVLQPILQPEEVAYIFGRVAAACSESLAGLLDSLTPPPPPPPPPAAAPPTGASGLLRGLGGGGAAAAAAAAAATEAHAAATAAWEASRRANALFMLQALSTLPLDPTRASSYMTRLATFYTKHFGLLPADAQARPTTAVAVAVAAAPAVTTGPGVAATLPTPPGAADGSLVTGQAAPPSAPAPAAVAPTPTPAETARGPRAASAASPVPVPGSVPADLATDRTAAPSSVSDPDEGNPAPMTPAALFTAAPTASVQSPPSPLHQHHQPSQPQPQDPQQSVETPQVLQPIEVASPHTAPSSSLPSGSGAASELQQPGVSYLPIDESNGDAPTSAAASSPASSRGPSTSGESERRLPTSLTEPTAGALPTPATSATPLAVDGDGDAAAAAASLTPLTSGASGEADASSNDLRLNADGSDLAAPGLREEVASPAGTGGQGDTTAAALPAEAVGAAEAQLRDHAGDGLEAGKTASADEAAAGESPQRDSVTPPGAPSFQEGPELQQYYQQYQQKQDEECEMVQPQPSSQLAADESCGVPHESPAGDVSDPTAAGSASTSEGIAAAAAGGGNALLPCIDEAVPAPDPVRTVVLDPLGGLEVGPAR